MPDPQAISYSIVVVTWQSSADLRRLLESAAEWLRPAPEVVVVDNASTDGPDAVLNDWSGPSRFIGLKRNVGFGAASNLGVRASTRPVVVMLNPDTRLLDANLDRLAEEAWRLRAIVGPRLVNDDGSIQPSASGPPTGLWPWIRALWPGAVAPDPIRIHTEPWRIERRVPVVWLSAACLAARRELLAELGPFDPAIHLFAEDLDLGLRARAAGIPVLFSPTAAQVAHRGCGSVSQLHEDRGALARSRSHRAVVRRAFGPDAERMAWRAYRLNLTLRLIGKRLARLDRERDRRDLNAARRAGVVERL